MQNDSTNWKAAALRARGDRALMLEVCMDITVSSQAEAAQVEAAKAARRSLANLLQKHSPTRLEVAEIRYGKLIDLL